MPAISKADLLRGGKNTADVLKGEDTSGTKVVRVAPAKALILNSKQANKKVKPSAPPMISHDGTEAVIEIGKTGIVKSARAAKKEKKTMLYRLATMKPHQTL